MLASAPAAGLVIAATIAAVQSDPYSSGRVRSVPSRAGVRQLWDASYCMGVFGEFGTLWRPLSFRTRQVFIVLRSGQAVDFGLADWHPSWLCDGSGLP